MSLAEIGRALVRIESVQGRHDAKLDEIKEQTTRTNGRVDRLEDRATEQARELGKLNSAVFPRHLHQPTPESGEFLSLKFSPKVWAAIYAALGAVGVLALRWLERLLS